MAFRRSRSLFSLLASWVGWWVILAAWKLGPALPALYRVSREGAKGNANVQFGDDGFSATIAEAGKVAWEGHISLFALVLLIAVPPLLLWALWLRTRKRADDPELLGEAVESVVVQTDAERARERR
jgi:hypothetical protein